MYNKLTSRLSFNKFRFLFSITDLDPSTVVLISGSPEFFKRLLNRFPEHRMVFISDAHYPERRLRNIGLPLCRLTHVECGGPSNFISLTGYHNCAYVPVVTDIRRTIKHFLKFSIRPNPCSSSEMGCYTPEHKLNIHHLNRHVVYNTFFLASGFGQRILSPFEIGLMFSFSEGLA